jgi:hypothetical protein
LVLHVDIHVLVVVEDEIHSGMLEKVMEMTKNMSRQF